MIGPRWGWKSTGTITKCPKCLFLESGQDAGCPCRGSSKAFSVDRSKLENQCGYEVPPWDNPSYLLLSCLPPFLPWDRTAQQLGRLGFPSCRFFLQGGSTHGATALQMCFKRQGPGAAEASSESHLQRRGKRLFGNQLNGGICSICVISSVQLLGSLTWGSTSHPGKQPDEMTGFVESTQPQHVQRYFQPQLAIRVNKVNVF